MRQLLEPGEHIVSAVSYEGKLVIFGSYGTVIIGEWNMLRDHLIFRKEFAA